MQLLQQDMTRMEACKYQLTCVEDHYHAPWLILEQHLVHFACPWLTEVKPEPNQIQKGVPPH